MHSSVSHDSELGSALKMVHSWWAPVEASVRSRHPQQLDTALRDVHGAQYLQTIKAVRRSGCLTSSERHSLETEMSSRLVRARAVLGKWQAGLQEIQAAHRVRDAEKLSAALDKWDFSDEDPEITRAKADLAQWQSVAETMPAILRQAVEKKNVAKLREAMQELQTNGPAGVEGADAAQKLLNQYAVQSRAVNAAVSNGNAKAIHVALQVWSFDKEDSQVLAARSALAARDEQKRCLRSAVQALDGPILSQVIETWGFEKNDEDFVSAKEALERYTKSIAELRRLSHATCDLQALSDCLARWEFSHSDPVYLEVSEKLQVHENAVQEALDAKDGWLLDRLLIHGGSGPKSLCRSGSLGEEVVQFMQSYARSAASIETQLDEAANFDPDSAAGIQLAVGEWNFAPDDPHVQAAQMWLQLCSTVEAQNRLDLQLACQCGDLVVLEAAEKRAQCLMNDDPDMLEAQQLKQNHHLALHAVGAIALDVDISDVKGAAKRRTERACAARRVRRAVNGMDARWFASLATISKPPRILHGLLEMAMHVVAGARPKFRDPPRETDWKSCQRMVSDVQDLLHDMEDAPERIASGLRSGAARAQALAATLQAELGGQWSKEFTMKDKTLGLLFLYFERLFAYDDLAKEQIDPEERQSALAKLADCRRSTLGIKRDTAAMQDLSEVKALLDDEDLLELQVPFDILSMSQQTIGSRLDLASAWAICGGDVQKLKEHQQRITKYSLAAQRQFTLANLVVGHFTGVPPIRRQLTSLHSQNMSPVGSPLPASSRRPTIKWVSLTVNWSSGESVGELSVPNSCTVDDVKTKIEAITGIPARYTRLLQGAVTLSNTSTLLSLRIRSAATLTLVSTMKTLPAIVHSVIEEIASFSPADLDAPAETGGLVSDAAYLLVFGSVAGGQFGSAKRGALHAAMLETLHAVADVLRGGSADHEGAPSFLHIFGEPVHLTRDAVKSLRVPLLNLFNARRAVATGSAMSVIVQFVDAMCSFYFDFVVQRCTLMRADEAESRAAAALQRTSAIMQFASQLSSMNNPPHCDGISDVNQIASSAAEQIQLLASHGMALPGIHIECIRNAIDTAGSQMLDSPPAWDAAARLQWAESAMALQLAPVPHLCAALRNIAESLSQQALTDLAKQADVAAPCLQLLAAVIWILQPGCRYDAKWETARQIIGDDRGIVQKLIDWSPIKDVSLYAAARAKHLMLDIWDWVTMGCDGNVTLSILFAWVSLAMAVATITEMAQRLLPVHHAVKKALTKIEKAAPENHNSVKVKAWTSVLFLLDGADEAWWWLRLIRPFVRKDPPWTECEDGGVGKHASDDLAPHYNESDLLCGTHASRRRPDSCATSAINSPRSSLGDLESNVFLIAEAGEDEACDTVDEEIASHGHHTFRRPEPIMV